MSVFSSMHWFQIRKPHREPPLVASSIPRRSSSCTGCVSAKIQQGFFFGHLRRPRQRTPPLQDSSQSPLRRRAFLFANPSSLDCFPCPLFLSPANFTMAGPFSVSGHVQPRPSPPPLALELPPLFTRVSCPISALCRSGCPAAVRAARMCVAGTSTGWPAPTTLPGPARGPAPRPCWSAGRATLALAGASSLSCARAAATCGDGGHDICTERKVEDEVIMMLPLAVI
jgi:hypothetical protein